MDSHKCAVAELLGEHLIDLRQACGEAPLRNPRTGKPCHISQLYRYVTRGARAANGTRVRLQTVLTPSGRRTSREAIMRFIAALTDPGAPPPTPRVRKQQIAQAEAELSAAGFEVGGSPNKTPFPDRPTA
jgi:hypothetical protein